MSNLKNGYRMLTFEERITDILGIILCQDRRTANPYTVAKYTGNRKQAVKYMLIMAKMGILRPLTEEEKIELARHKIIQYSGIGVDSQKRRSNPSMATIRKYMSNPRHRMRGIFTITERGLKLFDILEKMKALVAGLQ